MNTVSLALLTWNRASVFVKTMEVSLKNTGIAFDEIVWVDNGSEPDQYKVMSDFMDQFPSVSRLRNLKNKGMAYGFNAAIALSRSDYVLLIGPDIIFPDGWAKKFYDYIDGIPDAGIVAAYNVPIESVPERYRASKEVQIVNGFPVLKAMPMEHYIFRRSILPVVGYWREDFGLYGWSDVEWLQRCEKFLPTIGLDCYVIPEILGVHLGSEGAYEFKQGSGDTLEYHDWKQREVHRKENTDLISRCAAEGWPYYSPF